MRLSTREALECWVEQEGNRYENLLIERGFLREEDRGDVAATREATREWRQTYIDDLVVENEMWVEETIEHPESVVPGWDLGGWKGWKPYRPEGKNVTTFGDVAEAIFTNKEGISAEHAEKIRGLASMLEDILIKSNGKILRLRCGNDSAVVEGTHRLAAFTYAVRAGLPVPSRLPNVFTVTIPEVRRDVFDAFCEDRPALLGKYHEGK